MIYHILNGDALLSKFPEEIPGERISFRECLIDGPVKASNLEEFWDIRAKFIEEAYLDPSAPNYKEYSKTELLKILSIPDGSQVYCWFEEDLFCQVNLWFVLNLLQEKSLEVFLTLPYPDSPYNFTKLTEKELIDTFETKAHFLSEKEREILSKLWIHYQNQDVFEAMTIAETFGERFPFLKPAVEAWRDSLPLGDFSGRPTETLLQIKKDLGTSDFSMIFREFQKRLPIYGFGDLQVKRLAEQAGIF